MREYSMKNPEKAKKDKKQLLIWAVVMAAVAMILLALFATGCAKEDRTAKKGTAAVKTEEQKDRKTEKNGGTGQDAKAEDRQNAGQAADGGKNMARTFYGAHGKLSVKGVDLVDQKGEPVQLKGVSTHGLQWYPQYVNEDMFRSLRNTWGVNVIRLAMYTGEGGYCSGGDKAGLESVIDTGVQAASDLGMYVIIDWHILSDNNPMQYEKESVDFFSRMSAKYADEGNVLYEICNEPNGGTDWETIRTYADEVIPAIRKNAPDAVVLVGTPTWSQDVDQVASDPLPYSNIMYTLHFYAGTHKDNIRNKLKMARAAGTPVFISEFSICDASGNGGIDYDSAKAWKDLINETGVSYCGWSLSNKNETSALILPSCSSTNTITESDLSETGKWLMDMIRGKS